VPTVKSAGRAEATQRTNCARHPEEKSSVRPSDGYFIEPDEIFVKYAAGVNGLLATSIAERVLWIDRRRPSVRRLVP